MTILLAGDIGGTKTILRLVDSETIIEPGLPAQITLAEARYTSQDYPDLAPMVKEFFAQAKAQMGSLPVVEKACFGIAGPVINNTSELTNLSWSLSATRLQHTLNIPTIHLINDFAAIGYGILGLSDEDIYTLQEGKRNKKAPIAVLGAGTGLGECFLIPLSNGRYQVYSSEGSHADFPPRSALEFRLLTYIRSLYNIERVSVERVVSGLGITAIYQFLRSQDGMSETPAMRKHYETWERELSKPDIEATIDLAAEVSKAALSQNDELCEQTMRLFIEAYGAEAGNLALKILPYGGVYVAGGIAPKILPLLKEGHFIKTFHSKGRMRPLMEQMPVYVVLNPKVGLIGASLYAALID
ncbi:glucokinase [Aphanothece hegewaldii CCALA 016]|uniref:Glucokinase n=1 Tax=Aphanothece hegewaldii CCALA 016 TaxID=2107694 RepID=A0A2T1LWP3_9CHRO|nr:glucokinase [Aphanothece hegewaldii]PSF36580.1 glucokinase [Aphanothece hegewaldii CCALA 016]